MEEQNKQRVIVYIDGFNFYYGLKKAPWKKYYWLDIVKLMESFLRPNQELVAVKYFSARPTDVGKRKRQDAFFQANKENIHRFNRTLGIRLYIPTGYYNLMDQDEARREGWDLADVVMG